MAGQQDKRCARSLFPVIVCSDQLAQTASVIITNR